MDATYVYVHSSALTNATCTYVDTYMCTVHNIRDAGDTYAYVLTFACTNNAYVYGRLHLYMNTARKPSFADATRHTVTYIHIIRDPRDHNHTLHDTHAMHSASRFTYVHHLIYIA